MRRVLLWSAAFTEEPKKLDIYWSLPHPSLFWKNGRDPPPCVLQTLRCERFMTQSFINKCHATFKFTVSDFAEQCRPTRGVMWHGACVHASLNTPVIVAADKDGDPVVMSLDTYLMEQNNNMCVIHKNGDAVYRKLGE